jgi:secondary thiamine-phosphate synthase enzyme
MRSRTIQVDTRGSVVTDLTQQVASFARDAGGDGLLNVFAPHATAGLALMETGSGSEGDLEELLARSFPRDDRYAHRHGGIGHGGDHLLPAFISPSLVLPVIGGEIALGTWQSIVLIDPNRENNTRIVRLSFVAA